MCMYVCMYCKIGVNFSYKYMFLCCVGQLKHLVGSHELGLSIQQETPQLLMEGDTLDDQDTSSVQEEPAMSPHEQDFTKALIPAGVDTTHERTNQLPMKVGNKSIGLPVAMSYQSTSCVNAPLESMGTSGTPMAHMSSPLSVTSVSNLTSLLDHVSSPLVTTNSSIAGASYSPNTISCALKLLVGAPYSVISSSPLSLNKPVANEVSSIVLPSSPSTLLSTTSSMPSSTSSTMPSPTSSSSIQSSTLLSTTSFHHHDTTSDNTVNLGQFFTTCIFMYDLRYIVTGIVYVLVVFA